MSVRGFAAETPARVLVVDDEEPIRQLLVRLLDGRGHRCATAGDAAEARALLATLAFDLVLCDMTMPGESGLELAESILRDSSDVAVVMVTAHDDPELVDRALELGAYGYVTKPFKRSEVLINVAAALRRRLLEIENRAHRELLEHTVQERTAELRGALVRLADFHEETIRRLASAAELRDLETGRHIDRMSRTCALVAQRLGLDEHEVELIRIASPMHDVGKIGIPDSILLKPGPLSTSEREAMKRHTEIGYEILRGSEAELLQMAATLAYTHHERVDGTGYPRGLAEEQIPVEGRIAAVADVFDALTSDRPYRAAIPPAEAVELMIAGRGTQFDPGILDAFLDVVEDVVAMRDTRSLL